MPPASATRLCLAVATLAAVASTALLDPAGAPAHAPATCRTGTTVFRRGSVKVMYVSHHLGSQPSLKWRSYYACRPAAKKPRLVYEGDPATFEHVYGFRIFGSRLGFVATSEGYAGGGEAIVAWLDLETGQLRVGTINVNAEQYTPASAPRVPIGHVHFAIAPNGTFAVLGEDGPEQEIAMLTVGRFRLRPPVRLLYTQAGAVEPDSLAIDETTVTWRTRTGRAESAPT